MISPQPFKVRLELHPPWLCATFCSIFPLLVLHLILYLLHIHSLPYSPTFYLHYHKWDLHPARWGIIIHRRIKKHTLREHLHSRKQPIFIVHRMFTIQSSSIMHCVLCLGWLMSPISLLIQDDHIYQEISDDESGYPVESTLLSNIGGRQCGSPTERPASRHCTLDQVITHYKRSTVKVTEPRRYCCFTPSASKSPTSRWGNATTIT